MMPSSALSRRSFLRAGAAACLCVTGVGIYTSGVEPHWIEVVHHDLPIANLPEPLTGQTLVQLSDLHVGRDVSDDFLRRAFEIVQRLEPAFVVVTGDFMTCHYGEEIDHSLRVVERLPHGSLGTVGILGNHDYGSSYREIDVADELTFGLRNLGIDVLRNARITLSGLTFVGLDDYWGPFFSPKRALDGLDTAGANLVLCHNPDGVDRPGWGDYQGWILSGHTHGGQCRLPYFRPPCLPVRNPRYIAGEIDLHDGRRLYINRALGHLLRVRFNVRPEITVFRLTQAG